MIIIWHCGVVNVWARRLAEAAATDPLEERALRQTPCNHPFRTNSHDSQLHENHLFPSPTIISDL